MSDGTELAVSALKFMKERDHYKEEARKGAEANATLVSQIETLEDKIRNLENEIMLRDLEVYKKDAAIQAEKNAVEDKDLVIRMQTQRIKAMEWLVETISTKAANGERIDLRSANYLVLAQEVIAEYPMYRKYAEPFKEALRVNLNNFVVDIIKKYQS